MVASTSLTVVLCWAGDASGKYTTVGDAQVAGEEPTAADGRSTAAKKKSRRHKKGGKFSESPRAGRTGKSKSKKKATREVETKDDARAGGDVADGFTKRLTEHRDVAVHSSMAKVKISVAGATM